MTPTCVHPTCPLRDRCVHGCTQSNEQRSYMVVWPAEGQRCPEFREKVG